MHANRPANDNACPSGNPPTTDSCDGSLLVALLNARSALEQLLPHAGDAPLKDQSYAIGAIQQADAVIDRMGVMHVR